MGLNNMSVHLKTLLLLIIVLSTNAFGQTINFPACQTNYSYTAPFVYVETPPSTHSSWNVCVRALPCQALVQRDDPPRTITPPEITVAGDQVEIKATFVDYGFALCPPPQFSRLTLPPVSSPGPITIRYSSRAVPEGLIQVVTAPYTFRQQITTTALTPVPTFGGLGILSMTLLVLALGLRAGRR